ncbi:hypothetical protein B7463_g2559, partial [Scytalidium lignicola]
MITSIPASETRETVMGTLHDHPQMIDLDKRVPIKPPPEVTTEEYHYKWHQTTGLWRFLSRNPMLIVAFVLGITCVIITFGFTMWLSEQTFACPSWAIGCSVHGSVNWASTHLGLVQGIINTIYGLGLSSIAYSAYKFGEAAIWPTLYLQPHTLKEINTRLSVVQGSLISLPQGLWGVRNVQTATVIILIALSTVSLQTGSTILGFVYTHQNITHNYESSYGVGGGLGLPVTQYNPPGPLPSPMASAMSYYTSWASGLTTEPMPDQRAFIVDRANLSLVGDLSLRAIKVNKSIQCDGHSLQLIGDVSGNKESNRHLKVATHIKDKIDGNSNDSVSIRLQPKMTVWIDSIEWVNSTRTISTLIFAAVNGTIEGGLLTVGTPSMIKNGYYGISAIACTVDIELVDHEFSTGNGASKFQTVSSLKKLGGPSQHQSPYGPHGDLALWLGVSVIGYGVSVFGYQPMFSNTDPLPQAFTTTIDTTSQNDWTIANLTKFIEVGSGAIAMTMTRQWISDTVNVPSRQDVLQLRTERVLVMLVPAIVVIVIVISLAVWNTQVHSRLGFQEMRLAGVSDLIESSQNGDISSVVKDLAVSENKSVALEEMEVWYGAVEGTERMRLHTRLTPSAQAQYFPVPLSDLPQ